MDKEFDPNEDVFPPKPPASHPLELYEPAEQVLAQYDPASLPAQMARNHPIHGIFGAAFEKLGGVNKLVDWAGSDPENYGDFLKLFVKMAPSPSGDVTIRKMEISVNPQLKRTALDGEVERDDR